ncbi:DUF2946 family protein [Acinetobacter qingfengensis]|uniref:DUF2946 domain-containing protein n=1 Tax=Acinetobacter qingfengensis TaxID=1262585 RepID=A0A1E7R9D7_9GAMM|nr:DUF2946 domain-containing protein [Acinetobacter qingfengensis]
MIHRSGILLGFFAVFLQVVVFLQPLLPAQFQVSPVCEVISRALMYNNSVQHITAHDYSSVQPSAHEHHHAQSITDAQSSTHEHHSLGHQCQYCTVYAHLVLPPELGIKEVLERIQIRLLFFKRQLNYVYFVLQRLFLLPQGRAPPALLTI